MSELQIAPTEIEIAEAVHGLTGPLGGVVRRLAFQRDMLEARLAAAESIIREELAHSADGVLICRYEGPLYCPCGHEVRVGVCGCVCDWCPNPDSFNVPPLPLFYSQCFATRLEEKS